MSHKQVFLGGTLQLKKKKKKKKTYQWICDVQKTQAQNLVIPRQMAIIDTFQVNINGFLGGTPQLKKPLSGNNVNNCSPSRLCAKNCDTGHNHPDHSRHSSHHLVITSKIKLNQKSWLINQELKYLITRNMVKPSSIIYLRPFWGKLSYYWSKL